MGEYFEWINVDKKERLEMGAFGSGFKVMEPCWVGNKDIDAVCTLMSGRRRGDLVIFCGDYCLEWPDTSVEGLRKKEEYGSVLLDWAEEEFVNITGIFKDAEGLTYMVYGDDDRDEAPCEGPFDTDIEHRRFVVNHTKLVYYDRTRTPIRCIWPHQLGGDERIMRFDPFPALFAKSNRLSMFCDHKNDYIEQDWVGDSVEAIDDEPPKGYLDVSAFYNYWLPSLVVDDDTLIVAMESAEFKKLRKSGIRDMDALKKLLPEYVIKGPIGSPRIWPKPKE